MSQRDEEQIRTLIRQQFGNMSWGDGTPAGREACRADFIDGAVIFSTSIPQEEQSVADFIHYMRVLAGDKLRRFSKRALGVQVFVFGNVATAAIGSKLTENDATASRAVEVALFVKRNGRWQVVAQARQDEQGSLQLPNFLE